jgi:signal peptidase I
MLRKGSVYLNGNLLDESKYLSPEIVTQEESFLKENQTVTVPPDEYFVLGDNRPASSDSRDWGFVKKSLIIGKSTFIFWPLNKLGFIKNPYKN